MKKGLQYIIGFIFLSVLSGNALAELCQEFGPQAPRDIDNLSGVNPGIFSFAPSYREMNLCNLHFHKHAEHKAKDFSIFAGDGKYGGFQCNASAMLTEAESKSPKEHYCTNVVPGDTIEVHWVYSSVPAKIWMHAHRMLVATRIFVSKPRSFSW